MSKPRILFITPLPPPVHGSAMVSQYIKDSALVQGEFECDFVNLSTSRKMDEIGKGGAKKLLRFIGSYFAVLWNLVCHRYDLCYLAITCHGVGFLKDAPFVLLCKLFGHKVLIHQHNKGMSNCVERWPYRWLMPLVYRNTTVMLLSWYLYPDIEKAVKREQVVICPNGIPMPEEWRQESKDKRQENNSISETDYTPAPLTVNPLTVNLLFLSNLIPSKGVYVLLDACKLLKDKGLKFICNFVGGESKWINREIFEAEVHKRGLDEIVRYEGPKYGADKVKYWEKSDIFVLPTYNETFGLVNIEAMQWKLPVVSTNEGGIPDIVINGQNGFVCERQDAVGLAKALEKLINNPELRTQMGEEGYRIYREKFTLEKFEEQMTNCLKQCCLILKK